MNNIRISI